LEGVLVGWLAELSGRASPATVNLLVHDEEKDLTAVEKLLREYRLYQHPYMPLDILVNAPEHEATLTVELRLDAVLKFRTRSGEDIPHLSVQSNEALNVKRMTSLFEHLCSYQLVLAIQNPKKIGIPQYTFDILPDKVEDGDTESLAAWRVQFKNLHKQVLYISIFNFTPAYGIFQIYPDDHASSAAIDPGEEIPYLVIDMKVPLLLKEASKRSGFRMRDIIKVFVTTTQADFSHYCMPDLQGWLESGTEVLTRARHAKMVKPPTETWYVDQEEIITSVD
jgi:hypothetical protein